MNDSFAGGTLGSSRQLLDARLMIVVFLICSLGVANIYSAALTESYWIKQIFWLLLGFGIALVQLSFDYRLFESVAYPLYSTVIILLLAVLTVGTKILGARRWLRLAGFTLQPSELMKVAIIFVMAKYFAEEHRDRGYSIRDLIRPMNITRPIAAIAALIATWSKNVWLRDPVGELARYTAIAFEGRPPEWDGTYLFRMLLITGIIAYLALMYVVSTRALEPKGGFEQRSPWVERGKLAAIFGPPVILLLVTWVFWQSELLGDPKAVIVTWLVKAGGPGGAHAAFAPVIWFRLVLCLLAAVYLGGSIFNILKGKTEFRHFVAPIDLVVLPMALIMAQPDLGTALLVGAIAFSMILFVGMRPTSVLLLGVSGVGLAVLSWYAVLKEYQKQRVRTFLDPESDLRGAGYHVNQSMIAVGSGRVTGKGFASGTQSQLSFLPEQHTDFAFSVWGEEHGFLGGVVLVGLYFLLVVFAVGIAARARDRFGALLVTGFTALIFWQAFVNMGMVIGLLPVVGVPLPMFSYGGSSLLTVMVGLGITLNVAYRRTTFG